MCMLQLDALYHMQLAGYLFLRIHPYTDASRGLKSNGNRATQWQLFHECNVIAFTCDGDIAQKTVTNGWH